MINRPFRIGAMSAVLVFSLALPSLAWALSPAEAFSDLMERASRAEKSSKASISIVEPAWHEGVRETSLGESVPADPRVRNTGNLEFSEVALEIVVPLCEASDGATVPAVELKLEGDSNWMLCDVTEIASIKGTGAYGGAGAGVSYRFLYESELAVGATTKPPYSQMIVAEDIDTDLKKTIAIGIHATAIAADGTVAEATTEGPDDCEPQSTGSTKGHEGALGRLLPTTGAAMPASIALIALATTALSVLTTRRLRGERGSS